MRELVPDVVGLSVGSLENGVASTLVATAEVAVLDTVQYLVGDRAWKQRRPTRAFDGLHREIADIFGVWAPGAVTNADLSFRTRRTAEKAPATMRVDIAVGILMARPGYRPSPGAVG